MTTEVDAFITFALNILIFFPRVPCCMLSTQNIATFHADTVIVVDDINMDV